jgi:FkbM family methyltransferase
MDNIRRALRTVVSPDSRIYRFGAAVVDLLSVIQTDGHKTWRILNKLEKGSLDAPPHPVSLKNLTYPIFIRPGSQDVHTVINNVIRKEYDQARLTDSPKWMIDAGAYIGDTSAYFLSRFSELKVVALEPNPSAFHLAKQNLTPYGERSVLLQKGLYTTNGIALFSGDNTGASIGNTGIEINCTTILSLMEQYSIPRIDILKMDIEGAEDAIFNSHPETWLNLVDMLIIEIHGIHLIPLISGILKEHGFSMQQYRSVWYCCSRPK